MKSVRERKPETCELLLQAARATEVYATELNLTQVRLKEQLSHLTNENELLRREINDLRIRFGLTVQPQRQAGEGELYLPELLNTEKARKAFGRAREKGYLRVEPDCRLSWLGTGRNRRYNASELAYLCGLVYDFKGLVRNQTGLANQYVSELMRLFHTDSQLYKLYDQVEGSKKTRPWIKAIEKLLEEE